MRIKLWGTAAVLAFYAAVGIYGKTIDYYAQREEDTIALAENLYFEAGNEPDLAARMVARVTLNRTDAKRSYWGEGTIADVVVARAEAKGKIHCQFSWTCDPKHRTQEKLADRWDRSQRIAQDEMDGKFVPPVGFDRATYYLNPKHSKPAQICWFKTHLVRLGLVEPGSEHVFYREPDTKAERTVLPKTRQVPECR